MMMMMIIIIMIMIIINPVENNVGHAIDLEWVGIEHNGLGGRHGGV